MSEWRENVEILGENIVFFDGQDLKASLKNSTKAAVSLAARAFYVEGECFSGSPAIKEGDYFLRPADGDAVYFVVSAISAGYADDVIYIFAAKCNAKISIAREELEFAYDEKGKKTKPLVTIHEDVFIYRDFVTRSNKSTKDGLLDQVIYTLMLPHLYALSEGDCVIMSMNVRGKSKPQNYRVESVSSALANVEDTGVDTAQLSVDLRGEKE